MPSIKEQNEELILSVSPPRNRLYIFKMTLLLVIGLIIDAVLAVAVWAVIINMEFSSISVVVTGIFMFWTACSYYMIRAVIWFAFGKEKIILSKTHIRIFRKRAWGYSNVKLPLNEVRNFRIAAVPTEEINYLSLTYWLQKVKILKEVAFYLENNSILRPTFAPVTGGRIKFDYQYDTIRFGNMVDDKEAKELLDAINKFLTNNSIQQISAWKPSLQIPFVSINEKENRVSIHIGHPRNIFLIIAMTGWLMAWCYAMFANYHQFYSFLQGGYKSKEFWGAILFLVVTLFAIGVLLNLLFSFERILIKDGVLKYHRKWSFHISRSFSYNEIKDLRVEETLYYKKMVGLFSPKKNTPVQNKNWIWTVEPGDTIFFNCGDEKVGMGKALSEASAIVLVDYLKLKIK